MTNIDKIVIKDSSGTTVGTYGIGGGTIDKITIDSTEQTNTNGTVALQTASTSQYGVTKLSSSTSSTSTSLAATASAVKAVQDSVDEKGDEIKLVTGLGAKNLLNITTESNNINGVYYTHRADGSVSVSCATDTHAQSEHLLATLGSDFYGKSVTITGCPSGGSYSNSYSLYIAKVSDKNTIAFDNGTVSSDNTVTLPNEDCQVAILVRANYRANGIFYPMLRYSEITNDDFVKFAMTNEQLTDNVSVVANLGAKNFLKITTQSYDSATISFTHNQNGSVTVYGDSNAPAKVHALGTIGSEHYGKTLKLTGCPFGGNYSTGYALYVADSSDNTIAIDTGNGISFDMPYEDCTVAIVVRAGGLGGRTVPFYPMVRDTAIIDQAFKKYAKDNVTLTDDMSSLADTVSGKQDAISDLSTIRSGASSGATAIQNVTIDSTTQTKTNGTVALQTASTSQYGVTKLSSSTSSTSTSLAATASAVRSAYNRADSAYNLASANAIRYEEYAVNLVTGTWSSKYAENYYVDCTSQTTAASDFYKIFGIIPYWFSWTLKSSGSAFKLLLPILGNGGQYSPAEKIRFICDVKIPDNYSTCTFMVRVFGISN